MSTIRKLIMIPVTLICHILAEIHAEYLWILSSKRCRNSEESFKAYIAAGEAKMAAVKAEADKLGMQVVNKAAAEVQGAVAAAPVLPH